MMSHDVVRMIDELTSDSAARLFSSLPCSTSTARALFGSTEYNHSMLRIERAIEGMISS